MLATERGQVMLAEAWGFYDEAVALLDKGDLREAAGRAWCASERATSALILERTGRELQCVREICVQVGFLGQESDALAAFRTRYDIQEGELYGDCFIDGHCEPEEHHAELIRNTDSYIRDAERLAG